MMNALNNKNEKLKILLIEDQQDFSDMLTEFLSDKNFDVMSSNNAEQGMGWFIKYRPDIVITDIQVPEYQDGIKIIMTLKRITKKLPVIAITGGTEYVDETDYYKLIELVGADAILKKPFPLFNVIEKIHRVLEAG